jgi:hypothetical protein
MQFVQQPGAFDGDDSLRSEILHERELLLGKGTDLPAV